MPTFMKNRRKRREFVDPLFGIPLANPPYPYNNNNNNQQFAKRQWKPYCPVDCDASPNHKCCLNNVENVDRILPIGPFVQPTLAENWMSALFELFGKSIHSMLTNSIRDFIPILGTNPLAFVGAKKVTTLIVIFVGFVLWTWLGFSIGVLGREGGLAGKAKAKDRKDLLDLTSKVVFAIEDNANWLKTLTESLEDRAHKNVNRFLCCFVSESENEIRKRMRRGSLECYPTKATKRYGANHSALSALECVSELVYDITLNNKKQK